MREIFSKRAAFCLFLPVLAACSGPDFGDPPPNLCTDDGTRCVSVPVKDLLAVDGDTFELRRLTETGREERIRLRLIGWDSPETGGAAGCVQEERLGLDTEERARELFSAGQTVTFLPDGSDRYGRIRAHVYLDGTHIGWLLSKDGLSRQVMEGETQVDWCA